MNGHLGLRIEFPVTASFMNFKSAEFHTIWMKVNMMILKPVLETPRSPSGDDRDTKGKDAWKGLEQNCFTKCKHGAGKANVNMGREISKFMCS